MPGIIDPETLHVDELPTIWSPVQWELSEQERIHELEEQARASLLWAANVPETILRLLLSETDIERAYEPPPGYDPEIQGEWDAGLVTYQFKRLMRMVQEQRKPDSLYVEYDFENRGRWAMEISAEEVIIQRV